MGYMDLYRSVEAHLQCTDHIFVNGRNHASHLTPWGQDWSKDPKYICSNSRCKNIFWDYFVCIFLIFIILLFKPWSFCWVHLLLWKYFKCNIRIKHMTDCPRPTTIGIHHNANEKCCRYSLINRKGPPPLSQLNNTQPLPRHQQDGCMVKFIVWPPVLS